MIKRIITGLLLVGVMLGMLFLRTINTKFFHILIWLFSVLGTWEMLKALNGRLTMFQSSVVVAFALCFAPVYVFFGLELAGVVAFCAIMLLLLSLVFQFDKTFIENVALAILTLFYPTILLLPFLLMNDFAKLSLIAVVLSFAIAACADTAAYFVGSAIGGRKLAENISPKKTISGAIGGIFGGVIGSVCTWLFIGMGQVSSFMPSEILFFVLIGILGAMASIVGDLVEGAIKRNLSLKDTGGILPGHGGVLDRIDGIMVCGLVVYVIIRFIIK